jgi:hypothetical protein
VLTALYDVVVPGGISNFQPSWRRVFHQYTRYQSIFGDHVIPQGRCRNRVKNTKPVDVGGPSRPDLAYSPLPDVSFKSDVIPLQVPTHARIEITRNGGSLSDWINKVENL